MPLCVDCLHFKTRLINKSNLKSLPFENIHKIKLAVKQRKEVWIFYCLFNETPQQVYVENNYIYDKNLSTALHLEVKGCGMADYFTGIDELL